MRGDLGKGALQQVKVPRVEKEKKKSQGRGGRKACSADVREKERVGARQSRSRTERSSSSRLPGCGEWMDGSKSLQR